MNKKNLLIGAHMSIAKGIEQSLYLGKEIGCTTIQIFLRSNRRWEFNDFTNQEIYKFNQAKIDTKIDTIVAHSRYLINLGSTSEEVQNKSLLALEKELVNCDKLGIRYLVLHPGAGNENIEKCINKVAHNINKILNNNHSTVTIALENTAGQGSYIGSTFEQLYMLLSLIEDKNRIGICFDTCHAWAAGYNFTDKESYSQMWHEFDSIIGLDKLKVIHLNNSKTDISSHIDRHEEIDKGKIALEAFKLIINDKRLESIPKILEIPYDNYQDLKRNLDLIKALVD